MKGERFFWGEGLLYLIILNIVLVNGREYVYIKYWLGYWESLEIILYNMVENGEFGRERIWGGEVGR